MCFCRIVSDSLFTSCTFWALGNWRPASSSPSQWVYEKVIFRWQALTCPQEWQKIYWRRSLIKGKGSLDNTKWQGGKRDWEIHCQSHILRFIVCIPVRCWGMLCCTGVSFPERKYKLSPCSLKDTSLLTLNQTWRILKGQGHTSKFSQHSSWTWLEFMFRIC